MPTYNKIQHKGSEFLAEQDQLTRLAAAVMAVFHGRKGFDWWFDDLETTFKNEIFEEVKKVLSAFPLTDEHQVSHGHIKSLLATTTPQLASYISELEKNAERYVHLREITDQYIWNGLINMRGEALDEFVDKHLCNKG